MSETTTVPPSSQDFEIDHVFVLTSVGAPEANHLVELGFIEGSPNTHPGQGTANRRFFFKNAMLEFLWIADPAEAQTLPARHLHLWDRWIARETGASPFGLCLRPVANTRDIRAPFASWLYQPSYSPTAMPVASNSSIISEPLLFFSPVHRRPDSVPLSQREPLNHPNGIGQLTAVRLLAPAASLASEDLRSVQGVAGLQLQPSMHYLMELTFDASNEQTADCRPTIPLVLQW